MPRKHREESSSDRPIKFKSPVILPYIVLAAACIGVLFPLLSARGWPQTHEGARYIILLHEFREAFLSGNFYPRWIPNLCGGYGYPTFVFYQPGFFFTALPFTFLPGYPLASIYAHTFILLFAGAVGVFKLSNFLNKNTLASILTVLMFLLTPYIYSNLYVRGDLSELMAMLVSPWPIYFMLRLQNVIAAKTRAAGYFAGLVLSLCVLIVSHPATTLFFVPVLMAMLIASSWEQKENKALFVAMSIAGIILAFILTGVYWLPLFMMKQYASYESAISNLYSPERHFVAIGKFFSRDWGFGPSNAGASRDEMSFALGLPHFILATLGILFSRKRSSTAIYCIYLGLILLMTSWALGIWQHLELLRFVQFPWRILSVTAVLQAICIAGLGVYFRGVKSIFLLACLFFSIFWYAPQFKIQDTKLDASQELETYLVNRERKFYTMTQTNEYLPRTVKTLEFYPRGDQDFIVCERGCRAKRLDSNDYRLFYEIESDSSSVIRINQFYFPGWVVKVDGERISDDILKEGLTPNGLMTVTLNEGNHKVETYYKLGLV